MHNIMDTFIKALLLAFTCLAFTAMSQKSDPPLASQLEQKPETVNPEQQIMSPLDVKDADIQDVIRTISKGYNLNIVLDKDVSGKVTMHFSNVPVIEGLKMLAKSSGYEIVNEGNVLRIRKATEEHKLTVDFSKGKLTIDAQNADVMDFVNNVSARASISIVSDSRITGNISGKLYQVNIDEGLRAILEGNGFTLNKRKNIYQIGMANNVTSSQRAGNFPGGNGNLSSPNSSGSSNFYIDYSNGKLSLDVSGGNLQDVIKAIAQKSDMQIITYGNISGDINAKLRDISVPDALSLLLGGTMFSFVQKDSIILIGDRNSSTPSGQTLSKSEIIQLKCIKADNVIPLLPKDVSASNVRVIKEQNALLVTGTSGDIVAMRAFVKTLDIPTPQVAINAVIVEYSESMNKEFSINYWLHKSGTSSYKNVPTLVTQTGTSSNSLEVGSSGSDIKKFLADAFGFNTSGKTLIGKLPDDFFGAVHILETQDKAKVLAQPSLVTLNGNKASINVSETQYFKVTTGSTLTSDYSIKFQPITFGIKLDITPWISQGGQITAEIAPEVSNSSGTNSDGYPNVSSRSLSTTVQLNDGETIILGGLIKNNESDTKNKIPFLGDIPLVGALFRTNAKTSSKTNLMIYITPHIVNRENLPSLDSMLQKSNINNGDYIEGKLKDFHKTKKDIDTTQTGAVSAQPESKGNAPETKKTDTLQAGKIPASVNIEKDSADIQPGAKAELRNSPKKPLVQPVDNAVPDSTDSR
jgi:type IV pilus assembly protein PilQ